MPIIDEFLGKVFWFYCKSEIGEQLMQSFGRWMCKEAKCKELNADHGHIVGSVMRSATSKGSKTRGISYKIAWEYTELGESALEGSCLVDACIIGSQIQNIQKKDNSLSNKDRWRQGLLSKWSEKSNLRALLAHYSDEDSYSAAPGSNSEWSSEDDC